MRLCSVNTTADIDSYILGVLWGILSLTSEGFWLCHKDLWYITVIKEHLDIFANSHISSSDTGSQYRLKITREKDVSKIKDILYAYNWAPRKAAIRPYPHGVKHDRDFIRAWVELHSHADMRNAKKKRWSLFQTTPVEDLRQCLFVR